MLTWKLFVTFTTLILVLYWRSWWSHLLLSIGVVNFLFAHSWRFVELNGFIIELKGAEQFVCVHVNRTSTRIITLRTVWAWRWVLLWSALLRQRRLRMQAAKCVLSSDWHHITWSSLSSSLLSFTGCTAMTTFLFVSGVGNFLIVLLFLLTTFCCLLTVFVNYV